MKVAVFSTKPYDEEFLLKKNDSYKHEFTFFDVKLNIQTAVLAEGYPTVCVFVNDKLDADVLEQLHKGGTRFIALRCAGFNNVDLEAAHKLGFLVGRVPAYSPYSIAEYTIGMILALSRKICRAYARTRDGNFSIDGLLGYDLHDKTFGVIGTGKIGAITAKLMKAFSKKVVASDPFPNEELLSAGVEYVDRDELFRTADVISLHCPLTDDSYHLICDRTIQLMKPGVLIINTSRGALVDTESVISGLKSGKIGALGLDVYEEEADFFFEDYSDKVIKDDHLARILLFPNVVVTGHQAYFTSEAMQGIVQMTLENIAAFENGTTPPGEIDWQMVQPAKK
ncbi:MAG: 2-hydroxyacid dehydrogenase [Thermoguttaceae bacterium]